VQTTDTIPSLTHTTFLETATLLFGKRQRTLSTSPVYQTLTFHTVCTHDFGYALIQLGAVVLPWLKGSRHQVPWWLLIASQLTINEEAVSLNCKDDMPDSWFAGLKADASESVNSQPVNSLSVNSLSSHPARDRLLSLKCSKLLTWRWNQTQIAWQRKCTKQLKTLLARPQWLSVNRSRDPATYYGLVSAIHCFGKYTGAAPQCSLSVRWHWPDAL